MRAFLTRRWILFALAVVGFAYLTFRLGEWQFHRLDERRAHNAQTETNLAAAPVDVTSVMSVGQEPAQADEWRTVTAKGSYDEAGTVLVRYQTRNGALGVDVVTPLRLGDGTAVLVDRGWMETASDAAPQPPAPPSGTVRITGWVRIDGTGDSTKVTDGSTRAISSREIGGTLDYPVRGGFIDVQTESPPAAVPLTVAEKPDLGEGPHFFYGLQWWFFGLLAVGGFFYLYWDERRKKGADGPAGPGPGAAGETSGAGPPAGEVRPVQVPGSEGGDQTPVDREGGPAHE